RRAHIRIAACGPIGERRRHLPIPPRWPASAASAVRRPRRVPPLPESVTRRGPILLGHVARSLRVPDDKLPAVADFSENDRSLCGPSDRAGPYSYGPSLNHPFRSEPPPYSCRSFLLHIK